MTTQQPDDQQRHLDPGWRKTETGVWILSLVTPGITVHVRQRDPDGIYYRIVQTSGTKVWKSLHTRDRLEAQQQGRAFVDALATVHEEARAERAAFATTSGESLTLKRLWDLYSHSEVFQKNRPKTQEDTGYRATILLASLGGDRAVTSLDTEALAAHARRRKAGGIPYTVVPQTGSGAGTPKRKMSKAASARSVEADLVLLRTMLHWAECTRGADGKYLLAAFPVKGMHVPKSKPKRRPMVPFDHCVALFHSARSLATAALERGDPAVARKWWQLEFAMCLAESTGHRITTIRQLRASDFELDAAHDFAGAVLRLRREVVKTEHDVEIPLTPELAREFLRQLSRLQVIGDALIFAQRYTPTEPVSTRHVTEWLVDAQDAAGLPNIKGGKWHCFRRKWRTERNREPLVNVMKLGGWTDVKTAADYDQPERDDLLLTVDAPNQPPTPAPPTPTGFAWQAPAAGTVPFRKLSADNAHGAAPRVLPFRRHDEGAGDGGGDDGAGRRPA